MKKSIALAILLLLLTLNGYSQTKNFIDMPYVETSAHVDTLVVPDRIHLNIMITEKDTKGKISVEELEGQMETTLKGLDIDTKDQLSLNDLASNFKKYFLKGQDVLKIKSYNLIVDDAMMAGRVIVALEKINVSNIRIDKTEFSGMDQLKLALKSKAILKAKEQAVAMCQPLNQTVGNAIHIADQSDNYRMNTLQGRAAGIEIIGYTADMEAYKPIDIQFEKIKVESAVNVKFKLE